MNEETIVSSAVQVSAPLLPAHSPPQEAKALSTPGAPPLPDVKMVDKYIKPSLIRYPTYSYKTGTQFFLSKREQIVVDAYLKTNSEAEATRVLNALYEKHGSYRVVSADTVNRWLKRKHVAAHIADKWLDQGKVNWMDQPKWEAWGVDVMQGVIKATVVMSTVWREFGKAKGWYADANTSHQYNTQINFLQSSGAA